MQSKDKAEVKGKKPISIDKPTGQKQVIDQVINKIWSQYDTDNNGYLDPDEVKQFAVATLEDMKSKHPNTKMPTDEEMVEAFKAYDKDGNGRIEKKEMEVYIKKTLGLY